MKNLALILSLFVFGLASAQNVPNGNFENWELKEELSPTGFTTLGLVSNSADRKVGNGALRLDNKAKNKGFGVVSNTRLDSGFAYGGFPYDERPLSLKFWAKYDLGTGDKAHILCYFKSKSQVMGIINFQIEGSSNGQFLEYSVPITWYAVGIPDTMTFFASSRSLYTNYTREDGFIIFDDMHFATIYNRNKNVENGDFEMWDTAGSSVPQKWFRTEDLLIDQEGDDFGFTWVSKVDDGYKGSATHLSNQMVDNQVVGGALLSHADYQNFFKPSFPVAKAFKYIEGYYRYQPSGGDSAVVALVMYNSGTLVGGGEFKIGTPQTEWTYFAFEIPYFVALADSASILLSAADMDNPLSENTELWIDEVRFADWTANIEETHFSDFSVYPNPAGESIQVSFENEGNAVIEISNMHGQVVLSMETKTFENHIDLTSLDAGMYQVTIINNEQRRTKKIVKYE